LSAWLPLKVSSDLPFVLRCMPELFAHLLPPHDPAPNTKID
jgi:hypothetical protein